MSDPFTPRQRGIALVVSLTFIVLIAVLVLSFIAMTQRDRQTTGSYSQSVRAQELALGALEEILGDLRQEIETGSRHDGEPAGVSYTSHGVRIHTPRNANTAMPARTGYRPEDFSPDYSLPADQVYRNSLPPSFVRASRSQEKMESDSLLNYDPASYPEPPVARATSVSTAIPSLNGRFIPAAVWNKPGFLGDLSAAELTDHPFGRRLPEWVYVSRKGSVARAETDLSVLKSRETDDALVGRYAYVIYNQGGLLDLNAAGYLPETAGDTTDSNSDGIPDGPAAIWRKGLAAFADLSQLPGLQGREEEIGAFLKWRMAGALTSTGSGMPFLNAIDKLRARGFTRFEANDSPLLSRQDLIDCISARFSTRQPLAFLSSFNRIRTAPAWSPTNLAGATIAYGDQCEKPESSNRNLPNVRFSAATEVIHYDDNGDRQTCSVSAGESLLSRRFSLAKLSWLTPNGPKAGISVEAIRSCFGLQWQSAAPGQPKCWKYLGPAGTTPGNPQEILTLQQVADAGREPDFFELLKAGILSGSLGKDPGEESGNRSIRPDDPVNLRGPLGQDMPAYVSNRDQHIIRIGANIIDQADRDGYPTAIYFRIADDPAPDLPEKAEYNLCFGIENLPYLTHVEQVVFGHGGFNSASGPYGPGPAQVSAWFQPLLWNPHQSPAVISNERPTRFRVVVSGRAYFYVQGYGTERLIPSKDFNTDAVRSCVYFDDSAGRSSAFYPSPKRLNISNAKVSSTGSELDRTHPDNAWKPAYEEHMVNKPYNVYSYPSASSLNKLVGFQVGTLNLTQANRNQSNTVQLRIVPDPMVTFRMEYWDGTAYQPYNYLSRVQGHTSNDRATFNNASYKTKFSRPDPRTDRFSASLVGLGWNSNQPGEESFQPTRTIRRIVRMGLPRVSSGFYLGTDPTTAAIGDWLQNQTTPNNAVQPPGVTAWYSDPDGVVRPGDGFRGDLSTGDGCQQFTTSNPLTNSADDRRRPVILDRPFQSVAELGYVYRDLPFRTLDFWSSQSADAALLELFSVKDEPPVVAGHVNPNAAPLPVLKAIVAGAARKELSPATLVNSTEAENIAREICSAVGAYPLLNRADFVTAGADSSSPFADRLNSVLGSREFQGNKSDGEAPVRALSGLSNFRTWNLMIDVIAQSGRMSPRATALKDFIVDGERCFWLHVAIDRYTGKIIQRQMEPVYE